MDTRSAQGRVRRASQMAATPRGTALFLGHHRGRCSDSGRDVQGGETHHQELGQTRESLPPARGAEPTATGCLSPTGAQVCALDPGGRGGQRPPHTQQRCTHMLRGTRGAGRTGGWQGDTHPRAGTHGRVRQGVREGPVSRLSPLGSRKETPGPEPVAPLRLKPILSLSHSGQT